MNEDTSQLENEHSFFGDEQNKKYSEDHKIKIEQSINSSNPEKTFEILNDEITNIIENKKDISYNSNSNLKSFDQQQINESLFNSRYWRNNKNHDQNNIDDLNNSNSKNEQSDFQNLNKSNENIQNLKNDEDFFFNEEDFEEKQDNINEITSIDINKNNLNENNLNETKNDSAKKEENKFISNTPEKINNQNCFNSYLHYPSPYSFIQYNKYNYSSSNKKSCISTNIGSSDNKIKKDLELENENNNFNNMANMDIYNNLIPKMNLNMVYYLPIQQNILINNTFINNKNNLNNISDNYKNINQEKSNESNDIYENNIKHNQNNISKRKLSAFTSFESKELIKSSINNNNASNNNYYKFKSHHKNNINNKSENNKLNLDDIISGKDTRTTVMIRNIPIKYTDEMLIEALEEFKGKYDCLYLPFDYEKNGNKGYAFINFVHPLHILYFYDKFSGKKWELFESSKICELNMANFQGISEIQKHAKNYKGIKKPKFYNEKNQKDKFIIPSKYLGKLKERFQKMKYSENKMKKILIIDSFE